MKKKIKIALIDSGVNVRIKELKNADIVPISFFKDNTDFVGHGTAIASILWKSIPCATIYSLKIFDRDYFTSESKLIEAFKYIQYKLDVNIIHLSSGINSLSQNSELEDICKKLKDKNIIIVSSFDNLGNISYPAAFSSVVGVYLDKYLSSINEYIYLKGSPINILGFGGCSRLPWNNGEYCTVSGSSFASPYITGKIANLMMQGYRTWDELFQQLENDATKIVSFYDNRSKNKSEILISKVKKISKAITFPINKEMHAILGNADLLKFSIKNVYDLPYSKNMNKQVTDIVYGKYPVIETVESYLKINWQEPFDTVILGHLSVINKMVKRNLTKYFLEKCRLFHKNIYCFDNISQYEAEIGEIEKNSNFVLFPHLKESDVVINTLGNLHYINKPVLAICGTSPKQGKFNIQLSLRRILKKKGYNVGQLGTEPSAALFGMDVTFPIGYEAGVKISPQAEIYYVNSELNKMSKKDIIIVGSQSQTVPYGFGNIGFYPLSQNNLLLASQPDAIILCVNFQDSLEYIKRTISFLSGYLGTKTILFVLFPYVKRNEWNTEILSERRASTVEIDGYKHQLEMKFDIPVFINGVETDELAVAEKCIDFFS